MAYYFSYDASIPNYVETEGFYTKEELHCTLAYSRKDLTEEQLHKVHSISIPAEESATITNIDIFNNHIVLLINNSSLIQTNKKILKDFSITEDHKERQMHVSINKGFKNNAINLEDLEKEYIGQTILLHSPKLIIKDIVTKEKNIISLISQNNKLKLKP